MGIENPQTYADWYWKNSVEASEAFDEQIESAFAPLFAGVLRDLPDIDELPAGIKTMLLNLAEPPSAGFGGFAIGVGVEMIDEVLHSLMNPAMKMMSRAINRGALETWLTSAEGNKLFSRGKIDKDYWNEIVAAEGYEDIIASQKYVSELAYPSIPDIILWARYNDNPDNVREAVFDKIDIPADEFTMWEWLAKQRLNTLQAQTLYRRGLIGQPELFTELAQIGWSPDDRILVGELGWTVPNAMLLTQGNLLQDKADDAILNDISIADINPIYARQYLDAILTKPASQDIIAYELRQDPTLSNLGSELRRIGIHDNYVGLYKELAYQIPPVADIITMAVREAFTPAIAAKFGQYQDFPEPLELWAGKKGLSPEWAKRYWAAHWSLPSPSQGFEMLHRGLITQPELDMLLRALDVMPFWREKMTGIAYRRLTRVDIRRMYRVGVLTESEVLEAYTELGYNERDAKRMSEFTVKQVLASQSKFTARDVIAAYSKDIISRSEADSLLIEVGVRRENVSFILSTAEYKRQWELTENRISAIRNLYKKQVYNADRARGELLRLDLPSVRVDTLMEQWYIDEKDKPVRNWTTAQTLGFMDKDIITRERGIKELRQIGYDSEHIDAYMK